MKQFLLILVGAIAMLGADIDPKYITDLKAINQQMGQLQPAIMKYQLLLTQRELINSKICAEAEIKPADCQINMDTAKVDKVKPKKDK